MTVGIEEEFVEKGAEIEHTRWANWQRYLHSKCKKILGPDNLPIVIEMPVDLYEQWERQINTPYAKLSEQEKESDRREVRTYLPLFSALVEASERRGRQQAVEYFKLHAKFRDLQTNGDATVNVPQVEQVLQALTNHRV